MDSVFELRQAKISKRIAAFVMDMIMFFIIFAGALFAFENFSVDYNENRIVYEEKCLEHNLSFETINENGEKYVKTWTIQDYLESSYASSSCKVSNSSNLTSVSSECQEEFNKFFLKNNENFSKDEVALKAFNNVLNYRISFYAISTLVGLIIVNLVFPLIFKNGQTLGKKIMHLGLVSKKGIKVSKLNVIGRFLLGIFAVEVMPLMMYFAASNVFGMTAIIGVLVTVVNFCLIVFTKNHTMIHDYIGGTIVIDLDTTVIFNTLEEMNLRKENAK